MSNELHQMIGRIDERTELMMKSMDEFKRSAENHNERIGSLERTRSYGMGVAASIGAIVSLLGSKIANALGMFH